jgi:hypothetical protein
LHPFGAAFQLICGLRRRSTFQPCLRTQLPTHQSLRSLGCVFRPTFDSRLWLTFRLVFRSTFGFRLHLIFRLCLRTQPTLEPVPLRPSAPLLLPVVLPGSVEPPPAVPLLPLLLAVPLAPVVAPLVVEPPVEDGFVVEVAAPDVVGEPEPVAVVVLAPVVAGPADAFAELLLLPLPPVTPSSTSLSAVLFW